MNDKLVASYLHVALIDFKDARLLAATGSRNAIYLLEQAAEKVIKAVLTSEGIHATVKHALDEMVDQIPDANPLKGQLRAVEHLSRYATSFRYPTAGGRILEAPKDFDERAAKVERVLDEALKRFDVDRNDPDKPAGRPEPIR